jgi:hypothetical protein
MDSKIIDEEKVEICSWYKDGKLVKQTANGVEITPDPSLNSSIIIMSEMLTRKQLEEWYPAYIVSGEKIEPSIMAPGFIMVPFSYREKIRRFIKKYFTHE